MALLSRLNGFQSKTAHVFEQDGFSRYLCFPVKLPFVPIQISVLPELILRAVCRLAEGTPNRRCDVPIWAAEVAGPNAAHLTARL